MAISPIVTMLMYLLVGALMGIMLAVAPDQHHRCPFKHRLILFIILLFGWLPMTIVALAFAPAFRCCTNNLR